MNYFLGQAANFSAKERRHHFWALGTARDSANLSEYLAANYGTTKDRVHLFNNGRSALAFGLKLALPKNSKVIINSLTCSAVVEAVKAAGCIPIYADIAPRTFHFDATSLRKTLDRYPDAKALIVQNTYGITVDISAISEIAAEHKLILVEDLAHCAGRTYSDGRECGTVGALTMLSFGKGKAIDVVTGGALVVRDPDLPLRPSPAKAPLLSDTLRAKFYPVFGAITRALYDIYLGRAILALFIKIRFIERSGDAKLNLARRLSHWQARLVLEKMRALPRTLGPLREPHLVQNRTQALEALARADYHFSDLWYSVPIIPSRYYAKLNFPENECPVATQTAAGIIEFPTFYPEKDLKVARKIIKELER